MNSFVPGQPEQNQPNGQEHQPLVNRIEVANRAYSHAQLMEKEAAIMAGESQEILNSTPELNNIHEAIQRRINKGESVEHVLAEAHKANLNSELSLRQLESQQLRGLIAGITPGDMSSASDQELLEAALRHKNYPKTEYRIGESAEAEIHRRQRAGEPIDAVVASVKATMEARQRAKTKKETSEAMRKGQGFQDIGAKAELSREMNAPGATREGVFAAAEAGWNKFLTRDAYKAQLRGDEERIEQINKEQAQIQAAEQQQNVQQNKGLVDRGLAAVRSFIKGN